MKKILTYGTFDVLHYGHINLLRRAKEMGDYLIVGVSTDDFNLIKGKKSRHNFNERVQILDAIKYIDEIIPESNGEQKEKDIKKYGIDTFVMGSDGRGKFDDLSCEVVYLSRTEGISSTQVRKSETAI